LADPADSDESILEVLGVRVEVVHDPDRARAVVIGLPATIGFDSETEVLPEYRPEPAWLAITKSGERAVKQPVARDRAGLCPYRGRPRLVQAYDPIAEVVYIFDLHHVPIEALDGFWHRQLVCHNGVFECALLAGHPSKAIDTMQMAGLLLGTAPGVRSLENVANAILGSSWPKAYRPAIGVHRS
jgi:hypothetical protein